MIRVSARLPGPFRISGGPIVALFTFFVYVCVVTVWAMAVALVYLAVGIVYAVTAGHNAWRKRHPKPPAVQHSGPESSEARRIRTKDPYPNVVKGSECHGNH